MDYVCCAKKKRETGFIKMGFKLGKFAIIELREA